MKPNILFITTDQHRYDAVGCYGNDKIRTPNLDRLAAGGVRMDRAYAESPICIPSRVTMITGLKSVHHGATHHCTNMRDDEVTIGQVLQENGYRTHFIGKPHFKSQQHRETEESIADWRDGKMAGWTGPYAGFESVDMILGHSNSLVGHYGEWLRRDHPEDYAPFKDTHLRSIEGEGGQGTFDNDIPEALHSSSYVALRTCEFLDEQAKNDQPFYCFASFPDPHWPIMPPTSYFHMYDDTEMPENTPYGGEAERANSPSTFKRAAERKSSGYEGGGRYLEDPRNAERIMRAYWGSVSFIDHNIGGMLDKLEELGLNENTLVIFTADHGEYMGAHGMIAKGGFLWEEFVRVPFIARFPGVIPADQSSDALISMTDVVPTILDLCEVDEGKLAPDGVSQADVLTGKADRIRDELTIMHAGMGGHAPDQHALVTDRWKLVYHAADENSELYDLKEDRCELNNLWNQPEYAEVQQDLTIRLLKRIICEHDKRPLKYRAKLDHYGRHVMTYEMWKPEFDALAKQTGIE